MRLMVASIDEESEDEELPKSFKLSATALHSSRPIALFTHARVCTSAGQKTHVVHWVLISQHTIYEPREHVTRRTSYASHNNVHPATMYERNRGLN